MLDDLRVAELSCTYAGAIAGRLSVDAGAEVILIEPPGGHPLRMQGPFRGELPDPETSASHLHASAGKRSVVVDLDSDPESARQIVLSAGVFITDLPAADLERMDLTWDSLRRLRPALLMAQIRPFGDTGPYRSYAATNLIEMALGGQLKITGDPGRSPLCNFGDQAEYQAGLAAFAAIMANLLLRDETGEGAFVDLSVQDIVATNLEGRSLTFNLGVMAERAGLNVSAVYGVYPCADGWVFLSAFAPALWEQLKDAARLPELDDQRFSTQAGRLEHNDELQAILTAWTLSQTGDDLRRFSQKGYPVTVAETPEGLLRSQQWATRGFVNQVDHPVTGPLSVLGPLWRNEGIRSPGPAPCLGEGNQEVLAALKGVA